MKFFGILLVFLLLNTNARAYLETPTVAWDNSTQIPLADGATFTGPWVEVKKYSNVKVAIKTDAPGSLSMQFSHDGETSSGGLSYEIAADISEVHGLEVTRRYYRTVYTDTSDGQTPTTMDLQTMLGHGGQLVAPANLIIGQDADAIVTRPLDPFLEIVSGKRAGYGYSPKLGSNSDIDTGSVPEDIIGSGGEYTGFPPSTVEKLECFSSSASDTGTLTIGGILDSTTDEDHGSETITLSGITPVDTLTDVWRAHTMRYDSGSATAFNVGTITCRHTTTTANVFLTIGPGRSQSNYMVFTCPYKSTCWIKSMYGSIRRGTSATLDGSIWFRSFGGSPRYRRPFTIGNNAPYSPISFGAIILPGRSDVKATVLFTSTNNIYATFGMEIFTIKDRP